MKSPNRCWEGRRSVEADGLFFCFLLFGVTSTMAIPWPKGFSLGRPLLSTFPFQVLETSFFPLRLRVATPGILLSSLQLTLTLISPNKMAHIIRPSSNYPNWMAHLFLLGLILSHYKYITLRCANIIFQTTWCHTQNMNFPSFLFLKSWEWTFLNWSSKCLFIL